MTFDVVTLFPGIFAGALEEGVLGRARASGDLAVRIHDLRRWGDGPHRRVDDAPFGGGPGMVMKPEPLFAAVEWIRSRWPSGRERVILLSPQGIPFDQATAVRLGSFERLVLLCGRYEGVDERVRTGLSDEEVSVGDFVVTGGELPAMLVIDAVTRLLPGVLGNPDSAGAESFAGGGLDHPHWTRPLEFRGMRVPDVLRSGDHGAVRRFREERAAEGTRDKRPDLLKKATRETAPGEARARE